MGPSWGEELPGAKKYWKFKVKVHLRRVAFERHASEVDFDRKFTVFRRFRNPTCTPPLRAFPGSGGGKEGGGNRLEERRKEKRDK